MKIILDTNVFISGIFFSGPPSQILKAWQSSRLQIVLSQEILNEYQRVAESLAANFPTIDILPIIELMTIHGKLIDTEGFDVSVTEAFPKLLVSNVFLGFSLCSQAWR